MQTEILIPAALLFILIGSLVGSLWTMLRIALMVAALARPMPLLIAGGGAWAGLTHGAAILRFFGM